MKDKIIKILLIVTGLAVLVYCIYVGMQVGKKEMHRLTIIHVNDTHSQNEPVRTGELAGLGGALERAAYVDSVRQADGPENVLLLHAGDFFQGSSYFTEFGGQVEVAMLNAIGYDAVTLGNHEFDNGLEALAERLSSLEMPVLVCNYDFSPLELGKYVKPYVIVEKAGLRIGIVGVTCSLRSMVQADISNRLIERDMVSSVQKCVDELRPQCDYVIALTHIGYTEHNPGDITDPMLVAATRGIDYVVGGHSHTFLTEPDFVKNLDGEPVPIVQTGWAGCYMGETHVTVRK